jgi:hypothetical protein
MPRALKGRGVSDDATLDSFAPGGEQGADAGDDRVAEPVAATSTWTPGGACVSCDATPGRLWRRGDDRVCGRCADWGTGTSPCDQ